MCAACESQVRADVEYSNQMEQCSIGRHPQEHVRFEWSFEGDPHGPLGTTDFKVYFCDFCGDEWT